MPWTLAAQTHSSMFWCTETWHNWIETILIGLEQGALQTETEVYVGQRKACGEFAIFQKNIERNVFLLFVRFVLNAEDDEEEEPAKGFVAQKVYGDTWIGTKVTDLMNKEICKRQSQKLCANTSWKVIHFVIEHMIKTFWRSGGPWDMDKLVSREGRNGPIIYLSPQHLAQTELCRRQVWILRP